MSITACTVTINWRFRPKYIPSQNTGKLLYESKIDFLKYNNGTGQKSFETHCEMEHNSQLMSFIVYFPRPRNNCVVYGVYKNYI